MKTFLKTTLVAGAVAAMTLSSSVIAAPKLNGSGASFPFPIYSSWFKAYSRDKKVNSLKARVDYQAKGSGAGIQDFINGAVDFAASDAAMKDEEIAKVKQGAVLLPMTAGEVVLAYNLKGVDGLKLPRDVYPAIFAGKVTMWNDPKIVAANPDAKLPEKKITVVRRSDSSGTTYVFTKHLAAINAEFKSTVGQGKTVEWPKSFIGAPKNDGVTAQIKQIDGSIGYIEYGYAKLTGAKTAALQNKDGEFVAPSAESGAAALAGADWPEGNLPGSDVPNLIAWATDPAGKDAYPIATFTWMLFYKDQDDDKAQALRDMVEYCLQQNTKDGGKGVDKLGYIPLPAEVIEKVRAAAKHIQ